MTNAEKYLKDEVIESDFPDLLTEYILNSSNDNSINIRQAIYDFFNEKVKPTLTEDERVILRNIQQEWKTIFRGNLGTLELHNGKGGWTAFYPMSHLFQFIKERRRILY